MKLPPQPGIAHLFPKNAPAGEKRSPRPYACAQIEVTSRCSTGCLFCPHTALSDTWIEGDMPLELYRRHIAPDLDLFDLVYLQGWGEPLLHPGLWDMLALAMQKGCRTGFTTNGTWLQESERKRLLDMGVNLLSVSFAGMGAQVHESLRLESDFATLCANFEALANLKKQRGCAEPWLELHFLMTRANLGDLPALVELAGSLGADEVVATNLAYSPSLDVDAMHVFAGQPLAEDLEILDRAHAAAARLKLPLRTYPLQVEPNTLVCDADPLGSVYVNHRGDVAACVYLGLTIQGRVPRYFHGEAHPFEAVSFGNVSAGLRAVLDGKERKIFVEAFRKRNVSRTPLGVFAYFAGQGGGEELEPAPAPCRHCYKMLGV